MGSINPSNAKFEVKLSHNQPVPILQGLKQLSEKHTLRFSLSSNNKS